MTRAGEPHLASKRWWRQASDRVKEKSMKTEWTVLYLSPDQNEMVKIAYRSPYLMAKGLQDQTRGGWSAIEVTERERRTYEARDPAGYEARDPAGDSECLGSQQPEQGPVCPFCERTVRRAGGKYVDHLVDDDDAYRLSGGG